MEQAQNTVKSPANTVHERRRSGSEVRVRRATVGVRLTPEERSHLDTLAAAAGISAAAYLRRAGLGGRIPVCRSSIRDADALRAVVGALGRIGHNLNQIARGVDIDRQADRQPSPDVAALLEVGTALDRIGFDVRRAMGLEGVEEPRP